MKFNVFRVMRHGTHEKQLSNVFAWLLSSDGTHELGSSFQRLFIEHVNRYLPSASQLSPDGYRVKQEVDTSGHQGLGRDIADIVLTSARATIVVENYESSDGHGHDYDGYLAHGGAGGRQGVVVLLCVRRESHRQADGWERAVVVTYGELLKDLQAYVASDGAWRRTHPRQDFFISELIEHFVEGPGPVSDADRIAFIKAMCETGEGARYSRRPQEVAAQEFADLVALHAKRQFGEGRRTLAEIKQTLKRYAEQTLTGQVNAALESGRVTRSRERYVGQWEWCVELQRADSHPTVFLEYGPTAVVQNGRAAEPVAVPDYTKVFVTREVIGSDAIDLIIQTDVGLGEVLAGLGKNDVRLRDAVLAAISNGSAG